MSFKMTMRPSFVSTLILFSCFISHIQQPLKSTQLLFTYYVSVVSWRSTTQKLLLYCVIITMRMGVTHIQRVNQGKAREQSVIWHDSCMVSMVPSSDEIIMFICYIMCGCCSVIGPCWHVWVARFLRAQGAWEVALWVGRPWAAASWLTVYLIM